MKVSSQMGGTLLALYALLSGAIAVGGARLVGLLVAGWWANASMVLGALVFGSVAVLAGRLADPVLVRLTRGRGPSRPHPPRAQ